MVPAAQASNVSYARCAGGEFPKFLTGSTGCGAIIMRANPVQAAEAWDARVKLDTKYESEMTLCDRDENPR